MRTEYEYGVSLSSQFGEFPLEIAVRYVPELMGFGLKYSHPSLAYISFEDCSLGVSIELDVLVVLISIPVFHAM